MSPVCGKPGIFTAFALNVTVGAAEATLVNASKARPMTARQVDALRIRFSPSCDGQVRLDPGSSGAMPVRRHRDSGLLRPETVATCSYVIVTTPNHIRLKRRL